MNKAAMTVKAYKNASNAKNVIEFQIRTLKREIIRKQKMLKNRQNEG